MKITNVDNQKIALRKKVNTGYLYENHKAKSKKPIRDYVNKRILDGKSLYRPFNMKSLELFDAEINKERELEKMFIDDICKSIVWERNLTQEQKIQKLYGYKSGYSGKEFLLRDVNEVVEKRLRKGLRRRNIPDTTKKMLYAISRPTETKILLQEIPKDEMADFIAVYMEDYHKKEQKENIIKSIELQHIKVQTEEVDGKDCLILASAKTEKKKTLFDAMKVFAKGQEGQDQVFNEMHQAIFLYFPECRDYLDDRYSFSIKKQLLDSMGIEAVFSQKARQMQDRFAQSLTIEDENEKRVFLKGVSRELCRKAYLDEVHLRKRNVLERNDIADIHRYWTEFITEKLEARVKKLNLLWNDRGSNQTVELVDYVWKSMIEHIAQKYIDMGKAVYHFAMPKSGELEDGLEYGAVRPEFKNGITSFDYEVIKANETIDRKLFVAITMAMNQFSGATTNEKNLFDLYFDSKKDKKLLIPDAVHSVLRYFGGASYWKEEDSIYEADRLSYVKALRSYFLYLRNYYYHYTNGTVSALEDEDGFALAHLIGESALPSGQYRKKYYSNNVPMFYGEKEIEILLDTLYDSYKERPAQIPAFNHVLKRKDMKTFYHTFTGRAMDSEVVDDRKLQFSSMYYFLLKEIYYYGFLPSKDAKKYFMDAIEQPGKNVKNKDALKNFKQKVDSVKEFPLYVICQSIMTEYAQQNNRNHPSKYGKPKDKMNFDHFPLLLYQMLQKAFMQYLEKEKYVYGFLKEKPKNLEMPNVEDYLKDWETAMYEPLIENIDENGLSWYIAAHFIPPKELNHLIGSMKNYIQFVGDIERRASCAGEGNFQTGCSEKVDNYKKVIEVLDFVLKNSSGKFSKEFSDYYTSVQGDAEDQYAKYLFKYLQYVKKKEEPNYTTLRIFFDEMKGENAMPIYTDGINPILNKNIEISRLYGMDKILSEVMIPVSKGDLSDYNLKKRVKYRKLFKEQVKIRDLEDQKSICDYQQCKNRIELQDMLTLTQITNELMSELISLAYLRERDLLYYQLGYYYMKICYDNQCPKEFRGISGEGYDFKEGAILYQIESIYTYGKSLIIKKNGEFVKDDSYKEKQTSKKLVDLHKSGYFNYDEGLQLFGQEKRINAANKTRNYIEHHNYYYKQEKNILQLYSEVYNSFFTYDRKLKKSVPVIFKNILLRYNIKADLCFENEQNSPGKATTALKLKKKKETDKRYVNSESFTYQVNIVDERAMQRNRTQTRMGNNRKPEKKVKEVRIDVWSDTFLHEVENLLLYKKGE